jgi:cyclomaltodextrinase / maltogenic alpha-amylase / neopullulanase
VDDFIFGTMATDALRLGHIRVLKAGVTHNHNRWPRDPLPGEAVTLELTIGPVGREGIPALDRAWVYWTKNGLDPTGSHGLPLQGQSIEMEKTVVEWDTLLWGYVQHFRAVIPGQPAGAIIRYRLSAGSSSEDEIFADDGKFFGYYVEDDPSPAWAQEAVVYQVFVDRFFPGQNRSWKKPRRPSGFYGGTLRGVTEKLDYIAELGATAIWLSPVFPSPSHHGYDATDLFEIEPRLGTKQDMRELLDAAHQRGLRILFDFVPNHWSYLHHSFQEAIGSPDSPYRDWYTFNQWPDQYETFFGVKELPKLNLRNPDAKQHVLDAASYWLDFGVDGYRVDHAIGPSPDFWADFRRITRTRKRDCWTFGEVVDPPDLQLSFEGLLDGCLDFILLEAFRQTFAFGRWNAGRFGEFVQRHEQFFPSSFSRPSFLDNHDMNRFLWASRGDKRRLKLAALCQFSLAGPPVIYQGTEVGLSQERDVRQGRRGLPEESRLPMLWGADQDLDLLAYYKSLIAFRRENPDLVSGLKTILPAGDSILAYTDEASRVMTVLNISDERVVFSLPSSKKMPALSTSPEVQATNGEQTLEMSIPPLTGVILV